MDSSNRKRLRKWNEAAKYEGSWKVRKPLQERLRVKYGWNRKHKENWTRSKNAHIKQLLIIS